MLWDIEINNRKLIKVDNPDAFLRFTLRGYKRNRGKFEQWKHKRLALKYKPFKDESKYVVDTYVAWGFLNKEVILLSETKDGKHSETIKYVITEKGLSALKWRIIKAFYPGWLSKDRKYAITTAIAIVAILISIIAIVRTF